MSASFSGLVELVRKMGVLCGVEGVGGEVRITDVVSDSRVVRPGALFCCIRGEKSDGHDYIPEKRQALVLLLALLSDSASVATPE